MNIQIFVVFHRNLFDECYKNIPPDVLQKYFTFVAVNESIPKKYTAGKYKILNEWELPVYDRTFQERGYNENSVIYHVYANNLHKDYTHIGFFQYDMVFSDNIIDFIHMRGGAGKYFPMSLCTFDDCRWGEDEILEYVIKEYESFFNVKFSRTAQYPLFNSYVIPVDTYEKVMKWIVQLYPKFYAWIMSRRAKVGWCGRIVVRPSIKTHFGHIGGIYERVMAYAIGEENLRPVVVNLTHDGFFKKNNV